LWIRLLFFIGLAALFPLAVYFWILNLDNQGDFYVSASFADVNGDGAIDIIGQNMRKESALTAFSGLSIWINQGSQRFELREYGLQGSWAAAAGDLDNDGDPDVVRYLGHSLSIDLNQGGLQFGERGQFRTHFTIPESTTNTQFATVTLGDLNSNGWLDVLVTGWVTMPSGEVYPPTYSWVLLNNLGEGDGLPDKLEISDLRGIAVGQAALADLDGDGDLDLFAAVMETPSHTGALADRVLVNDGAGNFSDSGQRLGEHSSTSVALGDLDGDGDPDALVGSDRGARLWINQGGAQGGQAGVFALSAQVLGSSAVRSVFLADLDGDGDLDAVVGGVTRAEIWLNDGEGLFTRSRQIIRYTHRHGLAVGDVNGDGFADIWVGKYDKEMRLWLNQGDGTFK
jgi:hypothetical protein